MLVLYLTSSTSGTGKTGVAAAIGKRLLSQNKKIGYLRPVVKAANTGVNDDASILQPFLGLQESREVLSPTFPDDRGLVAGLKIAVERVSAGKDLVIVEGPPTTGQSAFDAAASVEARIVGVEAFTGDFSVAARHYLGAGKRLAGIVVNKVPASRIDRVASGAPKQLASIKLLGIVPEERSPASMSVAELANDVEGSIVSGADKASSIIENVMLGANNPDHGPEYYSVRANKAVIIRSERPDMQLAALESPTSCLVLAGGQPPIQMVLRRAEAKNVPIVSTKEDVKAVVARIEAALRDIRLNERRIAALARLMEQHLDFASIM